MKRNKNSMQCKRWNRNDSLRIIIIVIIISVVLLLLLLLLLLHYYFIELGMTCTHNIQV